MGEGKVEISVDKWDEIRNENSRLVRENQELTGSIKSVKITLTSKSLMGNFKYDRWKQQNVFLDETKEIENVEYMNMSDLQEILRKEAQDDVKADSIKKDRKIINLDKDIKNLKSKNSSERMEYMLQRDSEARAVGIDHKKALKTINDDHKKALKTINDNHKEIVKDLKEEATGYREGNVILKNKIKILESDKTKKANEKKIKTLEEELAKTNAYLNQSNVKIEELEKTNMALLDRIPFWKRKR